MRNSAPTRAGDFPDSCVAGLALIATAGEPADLASQIVFLPL